MEDPEEPCKAAIKAVAQAFYDWDEENLLNAGGNSRKTEAFSLCNEVIF